MNAALQAIIGEVRRELEALYGDRLARLVLFGSQARRDAAPGADIDLLVVLQGPVSPGREIARSGPITAAISLKHDVVISCTFVSADRYAHEQTPLFRNVQREGIVL